MPPPMPPSELTRPISADSASIRGFRVDAEMRDAAVAEVFAVAAVSAAASVLVALSRVRDASVRKPQKSPLRNINRRSVDCDDGDDDDDDVDAVVCDETRRTSRIWA